ncbi:uncharacterized protein [Triticum aestivum]|uniref:uncharacterized protein isoform X2 n=1 Tax=Triticum aestivum TaxID=4565 RepID=UPI001D035DBD|nr:uncharacterized protein LOC123045040 isoform X2 [Triticum aestivum]
MLAVREDAVKHKNSVLGEVCYANLWVQILIIRSCHSFDSKTDELWKTCQSMVSLIARQRLSMLLIWYNVVVREDDSGKGATRQCSRCSGLESAITTDHCSPIVVPHPPSRCLRIRRRREVGSRFTSRQVDESFRGVC